MALVAVAFAALAIWLAWRSMKKPEGRGGWGLWGAVLLLAIAGMVGSAAYDGYKPFSFTGDTCSFHEHGDEFIGTYAYLGSRQYVCSGAADINGNRP
jgi:hypothetical protein